MKKQHVDDNGKHVAELEARVRALNASFVELGSADDFNEFFHIIHRPGWTSPQDVALMNSLVDATERSATDARHLRKAMLEGARAIGKTEWTSDGTLEDRIRVILGPPDETAEVDPLTLASVGGDLHGAMVTEALRQRDEANGDLTVVAQSHLRSLCEAELITHSEASVLQQVVGTLTSNARTLDACHEIERLCETLSGEGTTSSVATVVGNIALDSARRVVHDRGGAGRD